MYGLKCFESVRDKNECMIVTLTVSAAKESAGATAITLDKIPSDAKAFFHQAAL
jgi:hypothetical protein